jgi:hypothetical protein
MMQAIYPTPLRGNSGQREEHPQGYSGRSVPHRSRLLSFALQDNLFMFQKYSEEGHSQVVKPMRGIRSIEKQLK